MSGDEAPVAVVIGAAAGMGLATCRALARRGYALFMADRDEEALNRAGEEIRQTGAVANLSCMDGSSLLELQSFFDEVGATFGRINFFTSTVGTLGARKVEVSEAEFDAAIAINLKCHYFATMMARPLLRKAAPGASIVYMSSGAGLRYFGMNPMYAVSKAALLMMMRAFAHELGPEGIRVNAVCPGPVDTGFSGRSADIAAHEAEKERWSKIIPLGRVATPEDVGDIIAFLGSNEAGYLNGCSIVVDGGVLA